MTAARVSTPLADVMKEGGILYVEFRPNAKATLDDARAHVEAIQALAAGRAMPMLADIRLVGHMSVEVRRYMGRPEVLRGVSALAVRVESSFSRILGSVVLAVTRTHCPTKLFTDHESAREWLRAGVAASD